MKNGRTNCSPLYNGILLSKRRNKLSIRISMWINHKCINAKWKQTQKASYYIISFIWHFGKGNILVKKSYQRLGWGREWLYKNIWKVLRSGILCLDFVCIFLWNSQKHTLKKGKVLHLDKIREKEKNPAAIFKYAYEVISLKIKVC